MYISNIISAIKAGIITPSTKAELEKAEAERQRIEAALRTEHAPPPEALATFMPRAAEAYRELVGNLPETLSRDVPEARQTLKTLRPVKASA